MITPLSPPVSVPSSSAAAAPPSSAGTSSDPTPTTNSLLEPNQFLTLLVDNLKYQDPLDPTSSADFLSELAQLSQVETLQQLNATDQASGQAAQLANAAALIGDQVAGTDGTGNAVSGLVTGISFSGDHPVLEVGTASLALDGVTSLTTSTPTEPGVTQSGAPTSPAATPAAGGLPAPSPSHASPSVTPLNGTP
jgi:flagellar basal-body rod modification protein FlgD